MRGGGGERQFSSSSPPPPGRYFRRADEQHQRGSSFFSFLDDGREWREEEEKGEWEKLNTRHCTQPMGVLRIVEIILCLLIVCLLTSVFGPGPFKGLLFGQTLIMVFTGFALCLTFIVLLAYFFNLHRTHLGFWPWLESDLLLSGCAAIAFLVFSCLEAYYSTGAWANNCNDIGGDGIIHNGCRLIVEWAFAAFFCFILSCLYAGSAFFAFRELNEVKRGKRREKREFFSGVVVGDNGVGGGGGSGAHALGKKANK